MFDMGFPTPNRFGDSASAVEGITPGIFSEWTTGLTPSLFKSSKGNSSNNEELNPFDSLFPPRSRPGSSLATHQHSSSLSTATNDQDNDRSPTRPDEPTGQGSALNKLGLFFPQQFGGGRKRALSSPALLTPNLGLSSFDFGEFPLAAGDEGVVDPKGSTAPIQPSSLSVSTLPEPKQIKSEISNSSDSSPAVFDRPTSGASLSPESSAVVTPPDLVVSMPSIETQLSARQAPKAADLAVDLNGTFDPSALFDPNAPLPDGVGSLPYEQFSIPGFDMSSITADPGMFAMPGFAAHPSFGLADAASLAGPSGASPRTGNNSSSKKVAPKPASKAAAPKKKGGVAGAGAGLKGSQAGDDAGEVGGEGGSGSQLDPEEAEKRASHLERNRIAACKSRQKKKMKVSALETQAAEVSAQNAAIQQRALQLQQEVYHLRGLLDAHQGCNCEHVRGYLARETAGGGIPTIHALAGRILSLDYSNSPKLGGAADVYSNLAPALPVVHHVAPPLASATAPPVQLGHPIPLARKRASEPQGPAPVQMGPDAVDQFGRPPVQVAPPAGGGLGMLTRSRRWAGTDDAGPGFEQAVLGRHAPGQMQMQIPGGRLQKPTLRHGRSSSVPLVGTPGWEGLNAHHAAGSYFPQLV